ncbi:uncharacterized protein Tco025E_00738 [Trypanosoma conorhini]|uniref:Uncharacterized protein n=1 Tax=Trypanosoma conorhini TaxID=83891 RepID=A0A3R7LEY5_9TRYP|nr:uncharacterized protein Tco025E_00738 [Trypanosoma conorhini]RNF27080.1 hypothetical protein Tco025E_00738 [Trypanosoma conorhini]
MPAKYGRRAGVGGKDGDDAVAAVASAKKVASAVGRQPPQDEVVHKDRLHNLDDGVDEQTRAQAAQQAAEEKERLVKRIAEAPLGYTAIMPKLAELNLSNLWNDFLNTIHQDFDISPLTACLSQQLDDEDVTWNPDMLLVQLTSEMLDAAESGDSAPPAPDPAALEATGEARRRRKELLENADELLATTRGRRRRPGGEEEQATPENVAQAPAPGEASGGGASEKVQKQVERARGKESNRSGRDARPKDPSVSTSPAQHAPGAHASPAVDARRKAVEDKARAQGSRADKAAAGRGELPAKTEKK